MVGRIYHVGLTVSDLDKSIAFYRDILGLKYQGEIMMVGEETDKMFQKKNACVLHSLTNLKRFVQICSVFQLTDFIIIKEIHKTYEKNIYLLPLNTVLKVVNLIMC